MTPGIPERDGHQAAWTSAQRSAFGSALGMLARRVFRPVVFSPSATPKYEATSAPLGNRLESSTAATNLTAAINPVPGVLLCASSHEVVEALHLLVPRAGDLQDPLTVLQALERHPSG
jgi:hypothetical protein